MGDLYFYEFIVRDRPVVLLLPPTSPSISFTPPHPDPTLPLSPRPVLSPLGLALLTIIMQPLDLPDPLLPEELEQLLRPYEGPYPFHELGEVEVLLDGLHVGLDRVQLLPEGLSSAQAAAAELSQEAVSEEVELEGVHEGDRGGVLRRLLGLLVLLGFDVADRPDEVYHVAEQQ